MGEGNLVAQRFDAERRRLEGAPVFVAPNVAPPHTAYGLTFSASGDVISYLSGGPYNQLAWFDRAGRPLGALDKSTDLNGPTLSPDDAQVLADRPKTDTGVDLWIAPTTSGTPSRLETERPRAAQPVWSHDGQHIAFTSVGDLYWVPAGGGRADLLMKAPTGEEPLRLQDWSRDGRFLIYLNGGAQPQWRRDGRELFFLSLENNLMSREVHPGSLPRLDPPQKLFHLALNQPLMDLRNSYAVSRDGSRFLFSVLAPTRRRSQFGSTGPPRYPVNVIRAGRARRQTFGPPAANRRFAHGSADVPPDSTDDLKVSVDYRPPTAYVNLVGPTNDLFRGRRLAMITLKHILVPTDFSETSEAAANYGVALARAFNATLHLLHVEPRRDLQIIVERELVVEKYLSDPAAAASPQNVARDLLAKILTKQEEKEVRAEYVLRASGLGGPYVEIVRYAKERAIDLIVMGTHGRGFVAHMLMGSVAEKVVRKAPCPVLTVRHPEHEFVIPDEPAQYPGRTP